MISINNIISNDIPLLDFSGNFIKVIVRTPHEVGDLSALLDQRLLPSFARKVQILVSTCFFSHLLSHGLVLEELVWQIRVFQVNNFFIFLLFVQIGNHVGSELHHRIKNVELVVHVASTSQLGFDLKISWENNIVHVLSTKSKALTLLKSEVDELALPFVYDVVVTDELPSLLSPPNLVERASALHLQSVDGISNLAC